MSKQRAFANQEREYQARRLGKLGRALLMSCATIMSFVAIGLLAADQLYRPDTFVIKQLKIQGKFRYLEPATVEAVLLEQELGNFFSIELTELKAKVEELAWVQSADVRREWPDSVAVKVVEHQPAMRWLDKDAKKSEKNTWVSTNGKVISLPNELDTDSALTLSGNRTQAMRILKQAAVWKREFADQGLVLKNVFLSDSAAWTVTLHHQGQESDFDLLLGREEITERLARFSALFHQQLKFSERRLERVDARYPDGLAVEQGKAKPKTTNSVMSANSLAAMAR